MTQYERKLVREISEIADSLEHSVDEMLAEKEKVEDGIMRVLDRHGVAIKERSS